MSNTIRERVASNSQRAGSSDLALRRHGLDGERLLKLAHTVAQAELRKKASNLGSRYDDLVMFLTETALRAATLYDPNLSSDGYTFASYLYDIMARRTPDFYRRRSEGFGDRRYGNDARIVLTDTDEDADPDADFERLISERRLARYQRTANQLGLELTEWVVITLDLAAAHAEKHAA